MATALPATVTKTSTMRRVDAYRVGAVHKREDGSYAVVTGYHLGHQDDHGRYPHTLTYRPATEEEAKPSRIKEAQDELNSAMSGTDHLRRRKAENALRSIKGEELLPDLVTHGDVKREQASKLLAQDYDMEGRRYKARNLMVESGLFPEVNYATKHDSLSHEQVTAALHRIAHAKDDEGRMKENNQ